MTRRERPIPPLDILVLRGLRYSAVEEKEEQDYRHYLRVRRLCESHRLARMLSR